ncbi:hypothetical protein CAUPRSCDRAFT_11793 [Caulochytrium protostelioides]|uniref:Kinetochore protein Sos7 coiled-coil domain-containing protein n=1 Tax=Caulochytrium protostelioides TaxID=1555241 RepID=A0A4P9WW13_9FUNG|nr:hypothetical protein CAUPRSCDRAFT_11793 [Caulochytrium protostelioides]
MQDAPMTEHRAAAAATAEAPVPVSTRAPERQPPQPAVTPRPPRTSRPGTTPSRASAPRDRDASPDRPDPSRSPARTPSAPSAEERADAANPPADAAQIASHDDAAGDAVAIEEAVEETSEVAEDEVAEDEEDAPVTADEVVELATQVGPHTLYYLKMEANFRARAEKILASNARGGPNGPGDGELLRGMTPGKMRRYQVLARRPELTPMHLAEYMDLFRALKHNYLEQETKEKFLAAVLNIPPVVPTDADLAELEEEHDGKRQLLTDLETENTAIQQGIRQLTEVVAQEHAAVMEAQETATALAREVIEKTEVLAQREAEHHEDDGSLAELDAKIAKDTEILEELEATLEGLRAARVRTEAETVTLESDVARLEPERAETQAAADAAMAAVAARDPHAMDLAYWYQHANALALNLLGIHEVNFISEAEMHLVYRVEQAAATPRFILALRLLPPGSRHDDPSSRRPASSASAVDDPAIASLGRRVQARVLDAPVPIDDIVAHAHAQHPDALDALLAYLVAAVAQRCRRVLRRQAELLPLQAQARARRDGAGVDWDPLDEHVLVQTGGRLITLRLSPEYPVQQPRVEIVAVEPLGRLAGTANHAATKAAMAREREAWQARIAREGLTRASEIVPLLLDETVAPVA